MVERSLGKTEVSGPIPDEGSTLKKDIQRFAGFLLKKLTNKNLLLK